MKTSSKILQIPLPGGSGKARTGAVQFQDDWPGLFVRGDEAMVASHAIRELEKRLAKHPDLEVRFFLRALVPLADLVERDVVVSRDAQ
jgi:hypothetical protein